ncbi:MAG: monofunctional biosynthetic peptidoglycan transglycosylase [Rhodospirillaceae bacterium]
MIGLVILCGPMLFLMVYRFLPVPITPLMVIRMVEGEGFHKQWVPLEEISPQLVASVMASEDARFCQHSGFDTIELRHAIAHWWGGGRLRGASTISMQAARNLLLWTGWSVDRYPRKLLEAWITVQMELVWPKHRIMEVYLNIIEWGPGVYGAEAAAQHHYGVAAAALSRSQASRLAVVLPNPRRWDPKAGGSIAQRAATARARGDQVALDDHHRPCTAL